MIHSMTGYASATRETGFGSLSLDIRSVNSRYLELQFRMDDLFRPQESLFRELIGRSVSRGKMECRINWKPAAQQGGEAAVDADAVRRLMAAVAAVRQLAPGVEPLRMGDILRWPGVMAETAVDAEALRDAARALLADAIGDFNASRAREGEKLADLLRERVAAIRGVLAQITPELPRIRAAWEEKIAARANEVLNGADPDRVHQEIALFAQKMDVDEELTRLGAHLAEVERILAKGGACGKRLDFLMQELNREANTLGSKSAAADTTRASMELKVLIEQMREQIQNIE